MSGCLTVTITAENLRLDTLAKLLTNLLKCLNAVEREITGERRARGVYHVTAMSWDGEKAVITICQVRGSRSHEHREAFGLVVDDGRGAAEVGL